jgi:hypothetical protein
MKTKILPILALGLLSAGGAGAKVTDAQCSVSEISYMNANTAKANAKGDACECASGYELKSELAVQKKKCYFKCPAGHIINDRNNGCLPCPREFNTYGFEKCRHPQGLVLTPYMKEEWRYYSSTEWKNAGK